MGQLRRSANAPAIWRVLVYVSINLRRCRRSYGGRIRAWPPDRLVDAAEKRMTIFLPFCGIEKRRITQWKWRHYKKKHGKSEYMKHIHKSALFLHPNRKPWWLLSKRTQKRVLFFLYLSGKSKVKSKLKYKEYKYNLKTPVFIGITGICLSYVYE